MIIIGIMNGKLALMQAQHLQDKIGSHDVESEVISVEVEEIEGSNEAIIKETITTMETALLNNKIDIAVYPLEYLPAQKTMGVQIAGLSERNHPQEVLLSTDEAILDAGPLKLSSKIVVGASTQHRKNLLRHYFPDIVVKDSPLDVPHQLEELLKGEYDAIMIDKASIERLGYHNDKIFSRELSPREFVPAPGQGILAYQCRSEDENVKKLLSIIHQPEVVEFSNVERSVLKELEGNTPFSLGVYCEQSSMNYRAHAAYKPHNGEMKLARTSYISTSELAHSILEQLNLKPTHAE